MSKKITLLISDDAGAITRTKEVSKRSLNVAGVCGIVFVLLFACVLFDYAGLKYSSMKYRHLKTEVHILKADLKDRDTQIENFYSRIAALQTKLLKLNELEQEIRSYTAANQAKAKNSREQGVGGVFSPELENTIWNSEFYNQFLTNLDKDVAQLDQDVTAQSIDLQVLWETARDLMVIRHSTPSIRPLEGGHITSSFGFRQSPFSDKREFHSGVDFAAPVGTPVMATADGVVVSAGYMGGFGKCVEIDHGMGIVTRYGHLDAFSVKTGLKVARGDIIGKVGNTGRSTGPHLHYEVRLNGSPVNGERYLPEYLAKKNP